MVTRARLISYLLQFISLTIPRRSYRWLLIMKNRRVQYPNLYDRTGIVYVRLGRYRSVFHKCIISYLNYIYCMVAVYLDTATVNLGL